MVDIIIYTKEETLDHKRGFCKGEEDIDIFYWKFSFTPKKMNDIEKIYFATKGFIRGYFEVEDSNGLDILEWNKKSWVSIKPIPCKQFQGFKYADNLPELNKTATKPKTK